jgi:chaperonin GroEL
MARTDNLYLDSRHRLQTGIEKTALAVGVTMGTGGSNAVIEAIESPGHLLTNDGYTIANSILLADPIEDMGRKMLVEAINRANKASGDGSSTTCVLTAAMIGEGLKCVADAHPMDIKREMEACLPLIEESLRAHSRQIVTPQGDFDTELLKQVATISAEDEEIGSRIAEIYGQIGQKGIVYWDISKTAEDSYKIGTGITVEGAGFFSPYMCDASESGQNTNQIRVKKPRILLTKQKIASAADFNEIAAHLDAKDVKDLIVLADDIDPLVVPDLIKTRMMRGFRIAVVKMPVLWRDWWFADLAKATGATVVDPAAGFPMRMLKEEHLGTCGNIVVTKDDTFLDGLSDVSDYVAELEAENTDDSRLRASRLNTKTARYFVGAQSDSALSYRRLKVEDAISASYQALNGGIVAGGGVALMNASLALPDTVGGNILGDALAAPFNQIAENVGCVDKAQEARFSAKSPYMGLDTRKREIVDMFEAGIIDPMNVVLNAVRNAVSVAATVITAPTIVTLPREAEDANPLKETIIR